MTPKAYFDEVWQRCELFATLYGFAKANVTAALQPDELLRAEWATRVSALDLYVHELVAQNMLKIFEGARAAGPSFSKFQISSDTLLRIQLATTSANRSTAFDLEVRTKLSRITYQFPNDIADGIRLISPCKLWNEIALALGSSTKTVTSDTESFKKRLSAVVDRRNKIVHEGDLQPTVPRIPWPIERKDVDDVAKFILDLVCAIDAVV